MTERPLPAPRPAATPAAFERELQRAERYAQSALAPSTRRAYETDWRAFADWCAAHALRPIPAAPATVAAFLAAEADRGFRPVTIGRRAAAIAAAHRAQDHPNPCDSGAVAAVMSGIRREHGTAHRRRQIQTVASRAFTLRGPERGVYRVIQARFCLRHQQSDVGFGAVSDSRIAKWQDWLDNRIRPDLVTIYAHRDTFNEVVRIAAENEQLPDSYFSDFLRRTYAVSQAVAVRRQADVDPRTITLGRLLTEIASDATRLTREFWVGRWEPGPPPIGLTVAEKAFTEQWAGNVRNHLVSRALSS